MRAKHTALIVTAGFLLIPTLTWSQGPGGRGDRSGFGGGQWNGGAPGGAPWGGQGGDRSGGGDRFGGGGGDRFGGGGNQWGGQRGDGASGGGNWGGGGQGMGGGRSGRMMADPDQFFDQYSKDGKTLRKEDLPQQLQMALQFMGPQLGLTGNEWTRDQLKQTAQTLKDRVAQAGGMMTLGGGAPGMGGPGGGDPDRRAEDIFKRLDKNEDGVLEFNEMSESLQAEREKYDTNH